MERDSALTVSNLTKRYGSTVAVDRLTFAVEQGTIYGLLGPNGAGKTTTLECVEGLRTPDEGTIEVFGIDPASRPKELWDVIGVQLQESALPKTMTPREALGFFCRYHGVEPDKSLLDRFGLADKADKQYGSMSVGQRRRLSLALSVAHSPKLVLLDEPTAGLDVESRVELHGMMRELRRAGTTIVLSTHDMAEAEKLCDRIGIIIGGSLGLEGTPSQITAAGDTRTKIRIASTRSTVLTARPDLPAACATDAEDGYAAYWSERPAESVAAALSYLHEHDDELVDLRVERPSLEERFMEITAKGGR
ncbi:MAG: ABC transporter ATP-binding protein [Spirochaetaceae bacterium]|nr:MAG: ABC transporter ATP-binding protein [Spirochaetaceae bacterium]